MLRKVLSGNVLFGRFLNQNILYDMAIDIGETEAAALIEIIEFFVVDDEEVEDGGLEVVNVDSSRRCYSRNHRCDHKSGLV